ncbi:putative aminotransferase [Lachnellula suecica]|uniref:Putative aminotransferase n=1 Tax=Lachnellula suecica TaxID=602035 RepID=A0A8T9C272_9HELO|nr:putative aminotransferase [Lachnellula suecica]
MAQAILPYSLASNRSTPSTDDSQDNPNPAILHHLLPQPSLFHPSYDIVRTDGSYITLRNSQNILDACSAEAIIGWGNVEVIKAMVEQYAQSLSYTTGLAEELAECILATRASGFAHGLVKAWFCCNGSEANDAALKLCRQYFFERGEHERKFFVSSKHPSLGNSMGSIRISTKQFRNIQNEPVIISNPAFVSPAYAYRKQRSEEPEEDYVKRLIAKLRKEFRRIGPEKVISFTAEPMVGATSGCVAAPEGYFPAVRELCDEYGILLHLDETMCGMGRTGTYFAFERENIVPDVVTIGKSLSGGYAPIAGILISQKCIGRLRRGSSSFNYDNIYQAPPFSCAAALAVQRILRRRALVERCAAIGEYLRSCLEKTFGDCKYVGNIRGKGLFWALEFVKDKTAKEPLSPEFNFGYRVQRKAFKAGLAVYMGAGTIDGKRGDHIILAPPFTISHQEVENMVNILKYAYNVEEQTVVDTYRRGLFCYEL